MKNLRVQLLASHMLVLAVMLVVMVGAVLSFFHLGRSIDRILQDNYRSVAAGQAMKDALERLDSSATFYLAGQHAKARAQYAANVRRFEDAHRAEANNITEPGEQELSDEIGRRFVRYRADMDRVLFAAPSTSDRAARTKYLTVLEPAFESLKDLAQDVVDLNQAAIVRANTAAKSEARRASWTAVAATGGAFVLAIAGALRMVGVSLAPLLSLAQRAEEIGAGRLDLRIDADRSDEIGTLAGAFNRMVERLRVARADETRRLHRAERMGAQALQSLYDPVVVTDPAGQVIHLNRAAEAIFGPVDGAVGVSAAEVVRDKQVAHAIEVAIADGRVTANDDEAGWIVLKPGDSRHVYRLRSTPMRDDDGAILGAVAVLEDVTYLREVDRLKSEFIGVASHELRTPVTSLLLSVQLLQEGAVGSLTPDQLEVVAAQRDDLDRLDRLTRDLLDTTRLESGRMPPKLAPVAPSAVVDAAAASVAAQADAKGVTLVAGSDPDLPNMLVDRSQIVRAVVNLLNNAIRHTPAGGSVSLRTRADEGRIAIDVSDTGPGIPAEYLPRIFDRFVQVPGTSRGGAGLGLSIARTIARGNGGEISVASALGSGCTFTISLPAASRATNEGA